MARGKFGRLFSLHYNTRCILLVPEASVPFVVRNLWQAQGLLEAISSNYDIVDAVATLMPCLASSHECASFIGEQALSCPAIPSIANSEEYCAVGMSSAFSAFSSTFLQPQFYVNAVHVYVCVPSCQIPTLTTVKSSC